LGSSDEQPLHDPHVSERTRRIADPIYRFVFFGLLISFLLGGVVLAGALVFVALVKLVQL
jgi:hypothetical protein